MAETMKPKKKRSIVGGSRPLCIKTGGISFFIRISRKYSMARRSVHSPALVFLRLFGLRVVDRITNPNRLRMISNVFNSYYSFNRSVPLQPFDLPLGPELEAEGLRAVSLIEWPRPLGRGQVDKSRPRGTQYGEPALPESSALQGEELYFGGGSIPRRFLYRDRAGVPPGRGQPPVSLTTVHKGIKVFVAGTGPYSGNVGTGHLFRKNLAERKTLSFLGRFNTSPSFPAASKNRWDFHDRAAEAPAGIVSREREAARHGLCPGGPTSLLMKRFDTAETVSAVEGGWSHDCTPREHLANTVYADTQGAREIPYAGPISETENMNVVRKNTISGPAEMIFFRNHPGPLVEAPADDKGREQDTHRDMWPILYRRERENIVGKKQADKRAFVPTHAAHSYSLRPLPDIHLEREGSPGRRDLAQERLALLMTRVSGNASVMAGTRPATCQAKGSAVSMLPLVLSHAVPGSAGAIGPSPASMGGSRSTVQTQAEIILKKTSVRERAEGATDREEPFPSEKGNGKADTQERLTGRVQEGSPAREIREIADKVYQILEKRILIEKERKGLL